VGYRAYTLKMAGCLGLTGGVKNLPDGRVEVVAEGPRMKLNELVSVLKQGPPRSQVTGVHVSWGEATGRYPSFDIWY
jgi:acylphosphatase